MRYRASWMSGIALLASSFVADACYEMDSSPSHNLERCRIYAERGNTKAQIQLAGIYARGEGVNVDH